MFKTFFTQPFKKYVKNIYEGLKKRDHFFQIFSNFARYFGITRFDILTFCNILHLEMNFGNLH